LHLDNELHPVGVARSRLEHEPPGRGFLPALKDGVSDDK
jgi:hypothetical protein